MNKSSNRMEVPAAKAAMDRFKTEVASELGVNLKEGYNGDLTSREAGSIGGEMVRRMSEVHLRYAFIIYSFFNNPATNRLYICVFCFAVPTYPEILFAFAISFLWL